MDTTPNQVRCDTCGTVYLVTAGNSAVCQVCGKTIAAPAVAGSAPTATVVHKTSQHAAPMARPIAPGIAAQGTGARAPAAGYAPQATPLAPAHAPVANPVPPHLTDPGAAVAARGTVSIETKPNGQDSESTDDSTAGGKSPPTAGRGLTWTIVATIIVVALIGGTVAVYLARPDLF